MDDPNNPIPLFPNAGPEAMGIDPNDPQFVEFQRKMKRTMMRKLVIGVLIGALSAGATALSCVGQSFSYRQARALENIAKKLEEGCKR